MGTSTDHGLFYEPYISSVEFILDFMTQNFILYLRHVEVFATRKMDL